MKSDVFLSPSSGRSSINSMSTQSPTLCLELPWISNNNCTFDSLAREDNLDCKYSAGPDLVFASFSLSVGLEVIVETVEDGDDVTNSLLARNA